MATHRNRRIKSKTDTEMHFRDVPGDPTVRTLRFQYRGLELTPWPENYGRTCHVARKL